MMMRTNQANTLFPREGWPWKWELIIINCCLFQECCFNRCLNTIGRAGFKIAIESKQHEIEAPRRDQSQSKIADWRVSVDAAEAKNANTTTLWIPRPLSLRVKLSTLHHWLNSWSHLRHLIEGAHQTTPERDIPHMAMTLECSIFLGCWTLFWEWGSYPEKPRVPGNPAFSRAKIREETGRNTGIWKPLHSSAILP